MKTYPDFLIPMVLSIKWNNKVTLQSISESYSLFIESLGSGNVNHPPKHLTLKELELVNNLADEYPVLPETAEPGSNAAVDKLLVKFSHYATRIWSIRAENKQLMRIAETPIAFSRPTMSDGKPITLAQGDLLKHFETNSYAVVTTKESNVKKVKEISYSTFDNLSKNLLPATSPRLTGEQAKNLLTSPLVTVKIFHRRFLDSMVMTVGTAITFTVIFQLLSRTGLLSAGGDGPTFAGYALVICLSTLASFIGFFFAAIAVFAVSDILYSLTKNPLFQIPEKGENIVLRVKLTEQGKHLVQKYEAWQNYKKQTFSEENGYSNTY